VEIVSCYAVVGGKLVAVNCRDCAGPAYSWVQDDGQIVKLLPIRPWGTRARRLPHALENGIGKSRREEQAGNARALSGRV
jgi:hypothetical protein